MGLVDTNRMVVLSGSDCSFNWLYLSLFCNFVKIIQFGNVTESPLPVNFNEANLNELADNIGGDIFDITEITDINSNSDNNSNHSNPETPHPSPNCSINHLDYDHSIGYFITAIISMSVNLIYSSSK